MSTQSNRLTSTTRWLTADQATEMLESGVQMCTYSLSRTKNKDLICGEREITNPETGHIEWRCIECQGKIGVGSILLPKNIKFNKKTEIEEKGNISILHEEESFSNKDWKQIKNKIFDQLKAYDLQYLVKSISKISKIKELKSKDVTRRTVNEEIFNLLGKNLITKETIFPQLNLFYAIIGPVSQEIRKLRLESIPIDVLNVLFYYYNIEGEDDTERLENLNQYDIWPTLGQLKRSSIDELRIFYRIYQFAIVTDITTEKELINKFVENMRFLGYTIDDSDYNKNVTIVKIEKVNIFRSTKEETKTFPTREVSPKEESKIIKQQNKPLRPTLKTKIEKE